jgi:ectoine hydroxylase-related dioxygenase (phytanoyl-CoA dioxygenase family)
MEARTISPAEMARYQQDGWMVYGPILMPEELEGLRTHVDRLIASLPAGKRPEAMDMAHVGDDFLLGICSHSRILDVVEQFIGPDIALFASHLIAKPKGDGKAVPWHQDSTYWPLEPMRVMTLWLAVDESTVENGCMRVIPGTHRMGPLNHQDVKNLSESVLHLEADPRQIREEDAVDVVLRPGECSFHEPDLLHGSQPNHSEKRRCGYTMRFMPAGTRMRREGYWEDHPLYLLRGEDRAGVNRYVNV